MSDYLPDLWLRIQGEPSLFIEQMQIMSQDVV